MRKIRSGTAIAQKLETGSESLRSANQVNIKSLIMWPMSCCQFPNSTSANNLQTAGSFKRSYPGQYKEFVTKSILTTPPSQEQSPNQLSLRLWHEKDSVDGSWHATQEQLGVWWCTDCRNLCQIHIQASQHGTWWVAFFPLHQRSLCREFPSPPCFWIKASVQMPLQWGYCDNSFNIWTGLDFTFSSVFLHSRAWLV